MMTNQTIAETFDAIADLLEQQRASPHRVRAWREGARSLTDHPLSVSDVFRTFGRAGLEAIPHIGRHLSAAIIEMVRTGRSAVLERLQGEVTPVEVFADLPGIGETLAERIHRELGVSTLEELERAAHDGRLERLEGFGDKRARAVRDVLATRLARRPRRRAAPREDGAPPVAIILDVDRNYRERAAAGTLHRIAPRRSNPSGEAWLPILHEERGGWSFTALFSNTPLAHKLGKTHDWVVVYHERHGEEGRATVVTETRGPLRGRRVVRGREAESAAALRALSGPAAAP